MKAFMVVGVALIALGALALAYGQFSYTKDSQAAKLGPIELTVSEKETVNIPVWAGVAAIASGTAVLGFAALKRS